jgi:G2/mitotic-specific cyclin 3/4
LRVRDENLPPSNVVGPAKTLHQRTKSTSALSTLIRNGIKANPQRRTAFADVSNTTRTNVPAKDDMILTEKPSAYDAFQAFRGTLQPLKEIPDKSQQALKSTALLRPSQRPLSAIIHKSLPAVPVNTIASAVPKHIVTEPNCDVANIRKVLTKRATTVFKENSSSSDIDPATLDVDASKSEPIPLLQQVIEPPREKLVPTVADLEPILGAPLDPIDANIEPVVLKDVSEDLIQSIQETLAGSEELHAFESQTQLPPPLSRTSSSDTVEQIQPKAADDLYLPALEEQGAYRDVAVDPRLPQQVLPEVQEYWEEDEEEEYYDAEGYTTARSFRSRGDNTTGGLTMLLEPRVTARSIKELEAAQKFVEVNRTEEDVEDEAWDTSMVAEYGDEIFSYMRELEVSLPELLIESDANTVLGSHEAKRQLHGEPGRDSVVDARCPYGLAHTSPCSFPVTSRDPLPRSQLCRSILILQGCLIRKASARRCYCHLRRC